MRMTVMLLLIAVFVATGCTSESSSYGNETVIDYTDDISSDRVEKVHTALTESEFQSITANITKENSTRYTVNLNTDIEKQNIGLNEQYRFQQTATLLDYYAFNSSETFQLNGYNTQSQLISQFTQ